MSLALIGGVDDLYRALVRFMGHLPVLKLTSALVLPEALSLTGAAAVALAYAMFSHAVSHHRAAPYLSYRGIRAPLAKSIAILVAMTVSTPVVAFALSPASFGRHASEPTVLAPAFIIVILPSTFCFAVMQHLFHAHQLHIHKLSRLQDGAAPAGDGRNT